MLSKNNEKDYLKEPERITAIQSESELQIIVNHIRSNNDLLRTTWVRLYDTLIKYDRNYRDLDEISPYSEVCSNDTEGGSIRIELLDAIETNQRYIDKIATITNLLGNII